MKIELLLFMCVMIDETVFQDKFLFFRILRREVILELLILARACLFRKESLEVIGFIRRFCLEASFTRGLRKGSPRPY